MPVSTINSTTITKFGNEKEEMFLISINDVLSRDGSIPHNHKHALFIYNLEPSYMSGSHWVATYMRDNIINSAHPDFEIRRVPCKSIYFSSPDRFDFA